VIRLKDGHIDSVTHNAQVHFKESVAV